MSFMRKIIDALNMDNWNRPSNMIEEKEEKPKNLFWDDTSDEENFSDDNEYSEEEYEEYEEREEESKQYEYVLFSNNIDIPSIIGSRNDYMRRDYTIDPRYSEYWRYLHKLWKNSVDLEKIVKNKKFFEVLEEFENYLKEIDKYKFKKFIPEIERNYYFSRKDEILIQFLDRSFTDEYRSALELKTPKGRIARIDHWFMVMSYYKQYLTPNAVSVLEALERKWTGELMPNLLEQND